MLGAMRTLATVLSLSCVLGGCAYQRYNTPLHAAPDVKLATKDLPPHMYAFRLISAEVPPTKISGLPWDEDGSGPDPFVRLYVQNQLVWESPVIEDQTRPEWNAVLPRNIVIPADAEFRLELWDRDTAVSADPIGRIERSGLPTTALPGAVARLELDRSAMISIMVSPPQAHRGVGLAVEAHSDGLKVLTVEPYSPAARAGIRTGQWIVGIGNERVKYMGERDAVSELALAVDRGHKLTVADANGHNEREVTLDQGYVWLVM